MKLRAVGRSRWAVIAAVLFTLMFAGAITQPVAASPGNGQGHAKGHAKDNEKNHDQGHSQGQANGHRSHGTAGTVGPVTSPQPLSKADQNDGGANGGCPGGAYCSTRDGSSSKNGRGDGQATGKPCAGCVGKADNKNPPGQAPDGSDSNAGYECDANQGIGQSNPAHTGCTSDEGEETDTPPAAGDETTSTDETETGCAVAGTDCTTGTTGHRPEVKGVEATAQPSVVEGVEQVRDEVNRAAPQLQPAAQILPNTGASEALRLLAVGGVILALAGVVTMIMQRRRGVGR